MSITSLHLNGPHKMPFALRDASKVELDNLEAKGILRKLRDCGITEWLSGASFVVELSRGMRLVTNLVQLNKVVKRLAHPFAPVGDMLNSLDSRARFFVTLDCVGGYLGAPFLAVTVNQSLVPIVNGRNHDAHSNPTI